MPKLYIKRGHGIVPNQLLNDENVSLKAKGMYAYIQSKPDGWQFSADRIALAHKESMYTIKTTLRELEKLKYLIRKKYQNEHGRWDWEYTLLASPSVEYPPTVEPPSVIPSADTPPSVSPPILVNKNYKKRNSKKELDIVSNDTISETSSLEGDVVSDFIPHQDEIIQAPPPTPSPRGNGEINRCLEIIASFNDGALDGAKGEQRQFANHLIKKLKSLPKVASGEYTGYDTLDTLLRLVAHSTHHRHKIGGAKSIHHNLGGLIQIAKGVTTRDEKRPIVDLSEYK